MNVAKLPLATRAYTTIQIVATTISFQFTFRLLSTCFFVGGC